MCLLSPIMFALFIEETMTISHLSPLVAGPYGMYDLPMTSIFWAAATVNFKISPIDS